MARSGEVFVTGKVKWARVRELNKFSKWSIQLYPDVPSLDKINQLIDEGIKNELKKDEDGYFITFSRPPDKTDRQGRKISLTPPTVVDKDNRVLLQAIGNGSDCSIKLETYGGKTPQGTDYKAARLSGVKVFNLIPYVPEDVLRDDPKAWPQEVKQVSGFKEQLEPVQSW